MCSLTLCFAVCYYSSSVLYRLLCYDGADFVHIIFIDDEEEERVFCGLPVSSHGGMQ